MDETHKSILAKVASQLADCVLLESEQFRQLLILAKLIPRDRIDEFMTQARSGHCRNLKLIYALQESKSPHAFGEFLEILEITENIDALKIISPHLQSPQNQHIILSSPMDRCRSKYKELAESYKSKGSPIKYPIGIDSGITGDVGSSFATATSEQSTIGCTSSHCDAISSPYKEKHQATLITSGNNPSDTSRNPVNLNHNFKLPRIKSAAITGTFSTNSDNSTPPISSHRNLLKPNNITQGNRPTPNPCRSSGGVLRPDQLTSLSTLSLSGDEDNKCEGGEPIVCWHPYAHSDSSYNSDRAHSPHHSCYPSCGSSSPDSDSSSDSHMVDPNLILNSDISMVIAREGPNMMKLKPATVFHNNLDEDYKMSSRPRGLCLIVNNIDFEGDIFPTRKGSDEDARRFDDLFQQLGFTVIMRRNQSAYQMKQVFSEVSASCKPEHDALFVFIFSHGNENAIYGTDGMEVYLETDVLPYYDNRNCKSMLGKPKVFVIQACRGRSKDCGGDGDTIDSVAWPTPPTKRQSDDVLAQEHRVPQNWLPTLPPPDGKRRKHPIRTDMLLVFSCLAGFVSVRNELAGSWLGVALAYFIMTHAHERDLNSILRMVTNDIIQRESSSGHIQSTEIKNIGWAKNLYFNPGIYR